MSRRFSLRAQTLGAAQLAIVLSITGAKGADSLTLNSSDRAAPPAPERIETSDNRQPAGKLEGGVLTVRLEARSGVWYPEGPSRYGVPVAAFAEEGKPLQNPGPLIRVKAGTEVRAVVRNSLDKPLTLFGLAESRGLAADSFVVEPGASREIRFRATEPGTYYYAGKTSKGSVVGRVGDDSQLNGAIIVDSTSAEPNDRVFMISWWAIVNPTSPTGLDRATIVINGRSWPYTERLDVMQGDSLRWRWINLTQLDHPLHLHGFYFRVDAVGDGATYTTYARDEQRRAVTEVVTPGKTMALAWSPTRPGNWVFHCHFVGHISPLVSIATEKGVPAAPMAMADEQDAGTEAVESSDHSHHATGHLQHNMAGLVLGIRVAPRGIASAPPAREYRPMRLIVRSMPNVYGGLPGYAYVLGGTPAEQDTSTLAVPGPTLVLEKNQPVAITVVNRSQAPAAVHWHGIELESFPDGVPGWSGSGPSILPAIAPNDSLTVRFTPPRAGTFMYHSHFDEFGQIASGLYGSIVVLDHGKRYDGDTDRVLLLSDDGPTQNVIMGPFPRALLNGQSQPKPMEMQMGVTYRFRLINIRTDYAATVSILEAGQPVQWRLVAKDGADLPPKQATMRPATLTFAAGEIYDVEFKPKAWGNLTLRFGAPRQGPAPAQATDVQVHVR